MIGRHRTLAAGIVLGLSTLLLLIPVVSVKAGEADSGTFGAGFLSVPVGARSMALPDVVAGIRPDASMIFSNPSATANIQSQQVFFSTATWLEDLNLSAASLVIPTEQLGLTWSLGARVLYSGGLYGYDAGGNVVEESSFYDLAMSAGLSKRIGGTGLKLGIGTTYLREHQPVQTGTAVLMSAGASYEFGAHRIDVFAADLGTDLSYSGQNYPIDSRVGIGYGHTLNRAWGALDFGAQMVVTRSENKRVEAGGAYHANRFITIRSGVHHTFDGAPSSEMPITAGLGFNYSGFAIDYAYTSQDFFPATHTFAFTYSFGGATGGPMGDSGSPPVTTPSAVKTVPSTAATPTAKKKGTKVTYLIIGGIHGRLESARAEVRALRLLNVPAVVEKTGSHYRVLIGRYDSLEDANRAANGFLKKGHRFEVIHEQAQ
jgi:hypothetical protein